MELMSQFVCLVLLVGCCDVVSTQVFQMAQGVTDKAQTHKHDVTECTNVYRDEPCFRWAAGGECDNNPAFMHVQCMKACHRCPVTEETELDTLLRFAVIEDANGCQCPAGTYGCSCCLHLHIPDIGLDDTVCLNVTYLVHDYGIAVTFSIDGRVIYRFTVSARNPPPLCFDIPELKKEASLCLDFYDLDISKTAFSACTKLEARLLFFKILDVDLGCFSIPLDQEPGDGLEPQASANDRAFGDTTTKMLKEFPEKQITEDVTECTNVYRDEVCVRWAAGGECDNNPAFMRVKCMKACHRCPVTEETDLDTLLRVAVIEDANGCQCPAGTYGCSCCLHLHIPDIGLDDTVCLNVTYLVHDYGIAVTFSIDGRVVYNYTVSARNPPPLCFDIPELRKDASLCLEFYNLNISKTAFSGCAKLEAELLHMKVADVDLGCFSIPLNQEPGDVSDPQADSKTFDTILAEILKELRGGN